MRYRKSRRRVRALIWYGRYRVVTVSAAWLVPQLDYVADCRRRWALEGWGGSRLTERARQDTVKRVADTLRCGMLVTGGPYGGRSWLR